jgi:hypothetical protein
VHRSMRGLERRLEALERKFADLPERLTPEEQARRDARLLDLCRAAVEGRDPDLDLTAEEAELLEKMRVYAPVFREMLDEGLITIDGQPGAPAARHDGGDHGEPVRQP